MIAASRGHLEVVRLLLESRADVDAIDKVRSFLLSYFILTSTYLSLHREVQLHCHGPAEAGMSTSFRFFWMLELE